MPYCTSALAKGYDACMVEIDENILLYIGGDDAANNYNEVFKYTVSNNTWTRVADMPTGRYQLGCGVVTGSGGGLEVVAVGGVSNDGQQTAAVEIYSVNEDTWRRGEETREVAMS